MDTAKTPAVAIAVNFVRNFFCILNLLVHKKIVTTKKRIFVSYRCDIRITEKGIK